MGPEQRIGTSGYEYADWRGRFYPPGLAAGERLAFYAQHFSTVELNTTFYGLPDEATVRRWCDVVPEDFRFSLKMSRYGTHLKRLRGPFEWIDRFERTVAPLGSKLGPVLVQLPPRWRRSPERLDAFLEAAPDAWRIVVEVRDDDWLHRSIYDVLRRHGACLCIHDLLPGHPRVVTTDWVYLRFHGSDADRKYGGSYKHQALVGAAKRIRRHLDDGLDVYAYFNNDVEGHAVRNATDLRRYVEGRDDRMASAAVPDA